MMLRLIVLCSFLGLSFSLTGQTTIFSNAGRTYTNTDMVTFDLFSGIDISNCATVDFSFNYSFSQPWEGSGNMESADECGAFGDPCLADINMPNAGGCITCWDFLYGAFSVDGSVLFSDIIGDAGTTDAEQSGTFNYRFCNDGTSNTAAIDIRTQTWAAAESVTFSNITVVCYDLGVSAIAAPDPACAGEPITLTGSITNPGVVSGVNWSGPGVISNASSNVATANNVPAGPALFTFTVTDNQGCAVPTEVSVDVTPAPIATPPPPIDICFSLSPLAGEIRNLAEVEDAIRAFDPSLTVNWWTNAAGTSPINFSNQAAVLAYLLGFPTTVYATVTDGTCESAVIAVTLNINPYPTPNDATLTACLVGGTATFNLSDADTDVTGGDGSLSVSYHNTLALAQNNQTPITTVNTGTDRTVFARVEGATGCVAYAEVLLDVTAGPTATNATLNLCDNGSGQATFDLSNADGDVLNGQTGTVVYYLNAGATMLVPNPFNFTTGSRTVFAQFEDVAGCLSTIVQVTLTVDPATTANDAQLEACDDGSGQGSFNLTDADATVLGGAPGSVDYYTNPAATVIIGNPFNFNSSGGTVYARIDDGSGCLSTIAEITLIVTPAVTAQDALLEACDNGSGQANFDLTLADATVLDGAPGSVDYYTDPSATVFIGNPFNFNSGNGFVYARIEDGSGCPSTIAEITLVVNPAPVANDTQLEACGNAFDQATFNLTLADADVRNTGVGNVSYYLDAAGTTPVFNPLSFVSANGTVFARIDDGSGCPSNVATITLSVIERPMAQNVQSELCDAGAGQATFNLLNFSNTILNGQSGAVDYYLNAGASTPVPNPSVFVSGSTTVYATIDDGNGCLSNVATILLTVNPLPTLNLSIVQNIDCNGNSTGSIATNAAGEAPLGYDWSNDVYDGLATLSNLGAGTYTVTVTDNNNCAASGSITLVNPTALELTCNANMAGQGSGVGSYSFTYSGGTAPYNLILAGPLNQSFMENVAGVWNTPVLPNGDYTFTIADANGCLRNCSFTIAPNCDLTVGVTSTPPTCNAATNGSITLAISSMAAITNIDWNDDTLDGNAAPNGLAAGNYSVTVTDQNGCTQVRNITLTNPPTFALNCTATMMPSGPAATDGSISVTITDGPGGSYTVSYNNGMGAMGTMTDAGSGVFTQTGLPTGTYTITVSNGTCTDVCNVVLSASACTLTLSQTGTTPTCHDSGDGSITSVPTSGDGNYTFNWSLDAFDGQNTVTGRNPGDVFSVTVTDGAGCVGTQTFTVPGPSAITVNCSATTNPTTTGGTDGSVGIAISGGTAPYSINWSGAGTGSGTLVMAGTFTASNLAAGSYTVTIADANGCMETCDFSLTNPGCVLTLDLQGTNPECANSATGSLLLTINTPLTITSIIWSDATYNGQTNISDVRAGMYSVTVTTVGGCVEAANITVVDPTAILVNCSATTNPTTTGGTDGSVGIAISGGTAPYSISWSGAGTGSGTLVMAGTFTASNLAAGSYTVTITDANGCMETCDFSLTNPGCVLTLDLQGTNPECANSATGSLLLTINTPLTITSIIWSDATYNGQTNISGVRAGIYSVTVTTVGGCVETANITVVDPPVINISCSDTTNPTSSIATNGSVNVSVAGGFPPYTIRWLGPVSDSALMVQPGIFPITGLSVGPYGIEVEDATGCMQFCGFILVNGSCTFPITLVTQDETCVGTNDGSMIAVAAGGQPPYDFIWNTTATTATITDLMPGIYTVTATDGAGCVGIARDTVMAGRPLPSTLLGAGGDVCEADCLRLPVTFSGQGPFTLEYTLTSNGDTLIREQIFTQQQDTLIVCPADDNLAFGLFTLQLTNISDANCSQTLNISRDFNYLPITTSNLSPTLCPGETLAVGSMVFDSNNPNGQVTLTAANGCDSLVNVNLTFYPASTFTATGTLCPGDTVTIGGQPFFFGNSTGSLTLPNASSNGCDSLITVSLTELAAPTTTLMPTICTGDTLTIAGMLFTATNPSGSIILPGAAANGCDSILVVNATVLPLAMTTLTPSICEGDSVLIGGQYFHAGFLNGTVVLENAATNGCDSIVQVSATLLPSLVTDLTTTLCPGESLQVGDVLIGEAGIYNISLLSVDGCDSLVNLDLRYYPPADGLFETTLCAGETINIGNQTFDQDNPSSVVRFPGGSANGCDSTLTVNILFLPNSAASLDTLLCFGANLTIGNRTFNAANPSGIALLEGAAANGCDSTVFVNTSYHPELLATLGQDAALCAGETATGQITLTAGETYAFTVSASTGGALPFTGVPGGEFTFDLPPLGTTTTFTLSGITAASGCPVGITDPNTTFSVSNPSLTLQTDTNGPNGEAISCAGLNDGNIRTTTTGAIAPITYLWDDGTATDSRSNLPAGTYSLTITDAAGCTATGSTTLIAPAPIQVLATGQAAGCVGTNTGALTISNISGGVGPFEYSFDNQFFGAVGDLPAVLPDLASGSYTLYIQDANDCPASLSVVVPEGRTLILNLGQDRTIQAGDSIMLVPMTDFTPVSWTWTPREGLRQPDSLSTYAAPLATTVYRLQATDAQGCSISDIVRIIVEQNVQVYIPSAFSPDGNGTNDQLMIFAGTGVERVEVFQIFDRWGNQVFAKEAFAPNDPQYGWDGRLNGRDMNPAVFVYFAQVLLSTGEVTTLRGEVVLVR